MILEWTDRWMDELVKKWMLKSYVLIQNPSNGLVQTVQIACKKSFHYITVCKCNIMIS